MFHLNFTIMDKDKIKDFFRALIGACRIVIPVFIIAFGVIYLDTKLKERREIENPGYYIFSIKENHKSERLYEWAPKDSVKSYFEASATGDSGYSYSLFYCLLKSGNVAIFCRKGIELLDRLPYTPEAALLILATKNDSTLVSVEDFSERIKQPIMSSDSDKKKKDYSSQQNEEDDAVDIIRTYMQTTGSGNVPF